MDRLPAIAILAIATLLFGCSDDRGRSQASRERVNAVQAQPQKRAAPAEICDVFHDAAGAPAFSWPDLTTEPPSIEPPSIEARSRPDATWRWINIWATWCKPCIQEMPRLAAWRDRLASRGIKLALHLISADDSDEQIASFRAAHPTTPPSLRLRDPDAVPAWMKTLGVAAASLPVHLIVDPQGRLRCIRASAVEETDYPAVEALLRSN